MKQMSKFVTKFIMMVAIVIGLVFGTASFAHADEPTSGTEVISSEAVASSVTTAKAASVNGVSITSATKVVSYIQANGATTAQKRGAKIRLSKRMTLWTSYYNTSHQEVWHTKTYPKGKVFIKGSDGWYHDPECWNKVKIKTKKPVGKKIYGAIKIVKKFVFSAISTSKVVGDAKATARAWCRTDTSAAEATGSGMAAFLALAQATGSGRTWTQAKAAASSSSASKLTLQVGTTTSIKIQLKTEAEGKATADASAKVSCSDAPPVLESPQVNVVAKACIEEGQSQDVTFTVHNPNNTAATLRPTFNGVTLADRPIGANATITVTVPNQPVGPFSGSVLLVELGKSASFNGEVKECPPPVNNRPSGEIVQWPAHLEPGEYYRVKVVGSDPEDGGAVELNYSVSGGATIVTGDANHPTICDVEGSNRVCTFWIRANQSVGVEYEITLRVIDGEGNFFDALPKGGMVQAMPV